MQLRPVPTATRCHLFEQTSAASSSEHLGLQQVVLLVAFGHAGIAEQHVAIGGLAVFHKRAFAHGSGRVSRCTGLSSSKPPAASIKATAACRLNLPAWWG